MRIFKLLALFGGVAIFAWIVTRADMSSVADVVSRLGIFGAGTVLVTFGVAMASDVIGWALMFRSVALSSAWSLRLWLVQMVGEAFNMLTPFGAFGGEPFKALLLNRHYGISYQESTATLILIQTVNSLAQVPFVILGTFLMLNANILPQVFEQAVLITTIVITVFMVLVYIALHGRLLARLPAKMENSESGARLGRAIEFLTDLEGRLFHFVRNTPGRSAAALAFAFLSWVLGAVEIYFVFWFLDAPITLAEAWIVETVIVLVRSVTFFVPGHLGVQDGALMAVVAALTGSNEIGVAMALIRRGRELFWAAVGLLIYGGFNLRDRETA